jgi:hypothetical protein
MSCPQTVGSERFGVAAGTDTTADPLWPLVLVLAEIAMRVERDESQDPLAMSTEVTSSGRNGSPTYQVHIPPNEDGDRQDAGAS